MAQQVDSEVLHRLLDLQDEDLALDRLQHRRDTLPEAQRLSEVKEQLAELEADIEIARKQQEELTREQSRLEGEIELLDQKLEREEKRLFSGSVSNPKELSSLQSEVQMLKKNRSTHEDQLLEIMVQREASDQTLASLEAERAEASKLADELGAQVAALTEDIDSQLETHSRQRSTIVGELPDDLLGLYERLRAAKDGIGAAALEGSTCSGCHTKLPAREVERVRAQGGLQRCENCRRILVVR